MSKQIMIMVMGILIALSGFIAYYEAEISIFMTKAKIKLLDIWIGILSGKKQEKK